MRIKGRNLAVCLSGFGAIAFLLGSTVNPSVAQSPLYIDTAMEPAVDPDVDIAVEPAANLSMDPVPIPQQWLPPEDDIPEEVLRTELILKGRSPIDGSLMAPEDYAALEVQLQQSQIAPLPIDSELQSLVFQLKLLNLLKSVFPFF